MGQVSIWQRLRYAFASFAASGLELPEGNGVLGRSSSEDLGGTLSATLSRYSTINPEIDFAMLETLRNFWLFNPDVSQYVANIQNLGNPGHEVIIDSASSATAERAVERLNEASQRIYRNAAGVDGLINAYLAQIAWSGALSSEDIVNLSARRVEQTVLVPVLKIRFRFNEEWQEYEPYQVSSNIRNKQNDRGLIPLHKETYKYYALQTVENLPYAKPPATAAVEPILKSQTPIMENLQYIAQKFGLLGLVTANVMAPPKKSGETDGEYQTRARDYISGIRKVLEKNMSKGLLVTYRDQTIGHTDVKGEAKGVYDLNRISEEQIMSGLGMMPAFFGRTDSTTETYADVVYSLLQGQVENIQRLPKRRMENSYRLDLRLAGIDPQGVSIQFGKKYARNRIQESQANETEQRIVLDKIKAGIISPDDGARELGYDSAFDPALAVEAPSLQKELSRGLRADAEVQSFAFRFDKSSQRYRHRPAQTNIAGAEQLVESGNVVPIEKKKRVQNN